MSQTMRLASVAFVAFVLFLLSASAASATPPTIFPFPSEDMTLSGICKFDVNLTVLDQNESLKIFSDGSLMLTGTFKVALTNAKTGKSIEVNVSGPVFVTPNPDGSGTEVLTGGSLLYFFPGDLPGGAPLLLVTTGPVVLQFDKFVGGKIVDFKHTSGTTLDVCAALA